MAFEELSGAVCPHDGFCGGCTYQGESYVEQLKIKAIPLSDNALMSHLAGHSCRSFLFPFSIDLRLYPFVQIGSADHKVSLLCASDPEGRESLRVHEAVGLGL